MTEIDPNVRYKAKTAKKEEEKLIISNKVVFITGGARGLGRAFAEKLLSLGAKVCIGDINEELLKQTTAQLQEIYGICNIIYSYCDVTSDDSFYGAWDYCANTLGYIDILINNAGIDNEIDYAMTYNVNICGTTRGTMIAFDRMGLNKGGYGGIVVNMGSASGVKTIPFGPIYGATKHAVVGLTRDLGHPLHFSYSGITVQCLCPGLVKTDFCADALQCPFNQEVATALQAYANKIEPMEPNVAADQLVKLLVEKKNGGVLYFNNAEDAYYVDSPVQ